MRFLLTTVLVSCLATIVRADPQRTGAKSGDESGDEGGLAGGPEGNSPLISSFFTYQGELLSDNQPYTGSADLRFTLYDASINGNVVGSPYTQGNLPVSDGRFTASISFGVNVLDGSSMYIGIEVRAPAGVGGFTTLAPRTRLAATPYALQTRGMFVNTAGELGIGTTTPTERVQIVGGSDTAPASGGYLVLGETTGLNVSLDNNEIMARSNGAAAVLALNAAGGNVGIGTVSPLVKMHVVGGTDTALAGGGYLVLGSTGGANISFDDNEIMARNNGGTANLALNVAGGDVNLVQNGGGNVGIGTNAADARLHVVGGGDVSPASGGQFVVGGTGGLNLAMDNNEIMARNNGGTATLYLNAQGGTVAVGDTGFANLDVTGNIFGNSLDVAGGVSGDTFGGTFIGTINTNSHAALFGRNGGNGSLVQWVQNNTPCGTISVFDGEVIYSAFTGSHYGWVDANQPPIERGTLMTMTGSNRRMRADQPSEIMYGVAPTSRANDPACLGAYLGLEEATALPHDGMPHLVMAVGNGELWVTDSGSDLQPGDLLISSDVEGCAMRDDPRRFAVGHVIARVAEPIAWNDVETGTEGVKRALVSVLFESFTRGEVRTDELERLRQENAEMRRMLDALNDRVRAIEVRE